MKNINREQKRIKKCSSLCLLFVFSFVAHAVAPRLVYANCCELIVELNSAGKEIGRGPYIWRDDSQGNWVSSKPDLAMACIAAASRVTEHCPVRTPCFFDKRGILFDNNRCLMRHTGGNGIPVGTERSSTSDLER